MGHRLLIRREHKGSSLASLLLVIGLALWAVVRSPESAKQVPNPTTHLGVPRARWLFLMLGLLMILGGACIRIVDTTNPFVGGDSLESNRLGALGDASAFAAISPLPNTTAYQSVQVPSSEFSLLLEPEATSEPSLQANPWIGEFSLVVLGGAVADGPPLWWLELPQPVRFTFVLPEGAVMSRSRGEPRSRLIADVAGDEACAAWTPTDTGNTEIALARIEPAQEAVIVHCDVPAAGDLSELRLEVPFVWDNPNVRTAGFARYKTAIRVIRSPLFEGLPTDLGLSLSPIEVSLGLPTKQRLVEAFPSPHGGSISSRSWTLSEGEIEFIVEYPSSRWWVGSAPDVMFLLAGAFLALSLTLTVSQRRS